jgi:thiol-disulfide isomerase/thioredoxin
MVRLCSFFIIVCAVTASAQVQTYVISGGAQPKKDTSAMKNQLDAMESAFDGAHDPFHLSPSIYHWGDTIAATYTIPSTSPYRKPGNHDSIFCIVRMKLFGKGKTLCLPMKRVSDSVCTAQFAIPDSAVGFELFAYSFNGMVGDPHAPGRGYDCVMKDGKAPQAPPSLDMLGWGSDYKEQLEKETTEHPDNYAVYSVWWKHVQISSIMHQNGLPDSLWDSTLNAVIKKVEATPDPSSKWQQGTVSTQSYNPGKYFALAELYGGIEGGDSASDANLRLAAASDQYNSIYESPEFGIQYKWNKNRYAILDPIVSRFPKSGLAVMWLNGVTKDTISDINTFRAVCNAWENSTHISALKTIAGAYSDPHSPVFNPTTSLHWYAKAEQCIRSHRPFYDGGDFDNIWNCSVENLTDLLTGKSYAYARAGDPDSAIVTAKDAFSLAEGRKAKTAAQMALSYGYLEKGDEENAKRYCGIAIALNGGAIPEQMNDIYEKYKNGEEAKGKFAKRMKDLYGKNVPNPLQFLFTTLDGKSDSLTGLQGKVVVLDFWYIGCPGCELEKQSMSALGENYKDSGNVAFLSIALDKRNALDRYFSKVSFHLPVVSDANGDIAKIFSINDYPTHVILGKDGSIFDVSSGGSTNTGDILRPKIEKALAAN